MVSLSAHRSPSGVGTKNDRLSRIHINYTSHPLWSQYSSNPEKLARALWIHLTTDEYLVLVAPGSMFAPTEKILKEKSWAYFRICFAAVDAPDVEKTSRGFVSGVQDFWRKKSLDDIEELWQRDARAVDGLVDLRGGC